MKVKAYITPEITITEIAGRQIICAGSLLGVNGDADIVQGEGETPGVADSRRRGYSAWDDEDEEDDW